MLSLGLSLKRTMDLKRKLHVSSRSSHGSSVGVEGSAYDIRYSFKRADMTGILETGVGYECHPETDQYTVLASDSRRMH